MVRRVGLAVVLLGALGTVLGASPLAVYQGAMTSQADVTHYWPLNDVGLDDTVGSFTGTGANVAATADVAGRADKALSFSGSGSEVVHSPNLTLPDQGTLEAYFRVDDKTASQGYFVSARLNASGTDRCYLLKSASQDIQAWFGNVTGVQIMDASDYNEGEWRYGAFTWQKSGSTFTVRTYYAADDGTVHFGTSKTGAGTAPSDTPFVFGRYAHGAELIEGALDNVAIYDTALSAQALQSHFALGSYAASGTWLSPYQQAILDTPGVIHYWPVDNASGEDVVGLVDRGQKVGPVSTGQGPFLSAGSSLEVAGDGYMTFADSPLSLSNTGTLECWVRADAAPSDRAYAFSARKIAGTLQSDRMYITAWGKEGGDELRFGFGDNADAGKICDIEGRLGEWVYVAMTWEPGTTGIDVSTYFADADGVLQAGGTDLGNGGFAPQDALLRFGVYSGGGQYWEGGLDEVAIYGRVLSLAEMQGHHDMKAPEPCTLVLLAAGLGAAALRRRRR